MLEQEFPESLALAADMWYSVMQERLKLEKQARALEEREKALKAHLLERLPKNDATGVAGTKVSVRIVSKLRPEVENWDALYDHIATTYKSDPGAFALLGRRVGDAAVKEAWAAHKQVPGVTPQTYLSLSYSAVK